MISRVLNTLAAAAVLTFAATSAHASKEAPVIGFSIDDLRVERWTHDRDYFVESAKKLGATVNVQSANANEAKQIAQIENLIAQNVDVLVIVPFNSKVLGNAAAVERWRKARVLVLDEISMLDSNLFDALDAIGRAARAVPDRPFGGLQLVLCGDFFQLVRAPPHDALAAAAARRTQTTPRATVA